MSKVVSIIAFILIIGLVIFIHEFGHFLVAKLHKVGVVEFSIGLGPRMFSFVRKGTRYSVKWIPFGGYCLMQGDESFLAEDALSGSKSGKERKTMAEKAVVTNVEGVEPSVPETEPEPTEAAAVPEEKESDPAAGPETDVGDDEHRSDCNH